MIFLSVSKINALSSSEYNASIIGKSNSILLSLQINRDDFYIFTIE